MASLRGFGLADYGDRGVVVVASDRDIARIDDGTAYPAWMVMVSRGTKRPIPMQGGERIYFPRYYPVGDLLTGFHSCPGRAATLAVWDPARERWHGTVVCHRSCLTVTADGVYYFHPRGGRQDDRRPSVLVKVSPAELVEYGARAGAPGWAGGARRWWEWLRRRTRPSWPPVGKRHGRFGGVGVDSLHNLDGEVVAVVGEGRAVIRLCPPSSELVWPPDGLRGRVWRVACSPASSELAVLVLDPTLRPAPVRDPNREFVPQGYRVDWNRDGRWSTFPLHLDRAPFDPWIGLSPRGGQVLLSWRGAGEAFVLDTEGRTIRRWPSVGPPVWTVGGDAVLVGLEDGLFRFAMGDTQPELVTDEIVWRHGP